VKDEIAVATDKFNSTHRLYSSGGSIQLAVWLQIAIAWVGWRFDPKSPLAYRFGGVAGSGALS